MNTTEALKIAAYIIDAVHLEACCDGEDMWDSKYTLEELNESYHILQQLIKSKI